MLFRIVFWSFTVIYGSLSLLVLPFPYKWRFAFVTQWARLMLWWLWLSCGVRYEIRGQNNIPKEPCVILCKHSSVWETLAAPLIFRMPAIVAKKSLLRIPFFGWMLAMCEPIAIDRKQTSSAMKQVLQQGKKRLEQGRKILLFPEGTRVPPGEAREYKPGGVLLAKRNHQKILPVSHNAGLFWSDKSFLIRPGKVIVTIGPLIDTHGKNIDTLNDMTKDWIEANTNV
tara:strand:+ start:428 stop:1108 length:681 start_codon:yes stop_codon:yes gene_type:complete